MKMKPILFAAAVAAAVAGLSQPAFSMGAVGGPNVSYHSIQGQLGEIMVNPYKVAPLTAIIKNGGYELKSATVRIVPKAGGAEVKYNVSAAQLRTHSGIPVFGLYANYRNKVEVTYVRHFKGKDEKISETYSIYAGPVSWVGTGTDFEGPDSFTATVKRVDPAFKDRLYLSPTSATRPPWMPARSGITRWGAPSLGPSFLRLPSWTPPVKSVGTSIPARSGIRRTFIPRAS